MTGRQDDNSSGGMTEAELALRLGELPRRIQPQGDPWPRILARISADDAQRAAFNNELDARLRDPLSLDLAERIDAEIVSADSRQLYRPLTIGTAKPSAEDLVRVPHHFIDELDLDAIPDGYELPTVFNAADPDNPNVAPADFGWSTIDGRVDANGDGSATHDPAFVDPSAAGTGQ